MSTKRNFVLSFPIIITFKFRNLDEYTKRNIYISVVSGLIFKIKHTIFEIDFLINFLKYLYQVMPQKIILIDFFSSLDLL